MTGHLDDLSLFVEVMRHGSFSAAAEHRGLSQSVVSKRIAKLEKSLGVQLLYRSTRRLGLTEAGTVLLQKAKLASDAAEEALKSVGDLAEQTSGHIRMSVPTISGELFLAEACAEFCRLNPHISIDLDLNNQFVDLIKGGFDLVIRTGELQDSTLIAKHLLNSRWVVVASPEYLRKHGRPERPQQLQAHHCYSYSYQQGGAQNWLFNGEQGKFTLDVKSRLHTNNARVLRQIALADQGLVYVPRCLVYPDLQSGELEQVLGEQVAKQIGIYAVYPFTKQVPKKTSLLIEHIKQCYQAKAHYF